MIVLGAESGRAPPAPSFQLAPLFGRGSSATPPPRGRYQKPSLGSPVSVSCPLLPSDERSYGVGDRVSGPASHGAASRMRGSRAGGHADGQRDPQSRTDRRGCGAAQRPDLAVMPIFLQKLNVSAILFISFESSFFWVQTNIRFEILLPAPSAIHQPVEPPTVVIVG